MWAYVVWGVRIWWVSGGGALASKGEGSARADPSPGRWVRRVDQRSINGHSVFRERPRERHRGRDQQATAAKIDKGVRWVSG